MDYNIYSLNRDNSKKEIVGQMHGPEDKSSHAFAMFFCAWVTAYEKKYPREYGYEAEAMAE